MRRQEAGKDVVRKQQQQPLQLAAARVLAPSLRVVKVRGTFVCVRPAYVYARDLVAELCVCKVATPVRQIMARISRTSVAILPIYRWGL